MMWASSCHLMDAQEVEPPLKRPDGGFGAIFYGYFGDVIRSTPVAPSSPDFGPSTSPEACGVCWTRLLELH